MKNEFDKDDDTVIVDGDPCDHITDGLHQMKWKLVFDEWIRDTEQLIKLLGISMEHEEHEDYAAIEDEISEIMETHFPPPSFWLAEYNEPTDEFRVRAWRLVRK